MANNGTSTKHNRTRSRINNLRIQRQKTKEPLDSNKKRLQCPHPFVQMGGESMTVSFSSLNHCGSGFMLMENMVA